MLRWHARLRIFAALAGLLLAPASTGCAKQLTAQTSYAEGVDFSQYRTYRWITDDLVLIRPGAGDPNIRNVENERRIRAAVERELAAKGLTKAKGADAQLIVEFSLGIQVRYQVQGGSTSLEMVASPPAHVTRGELTLYMFDRASRAQIWSAWTKKDLVPGDNPDRVINRAVAVLMDKFPPRTE